MEPGNSKAISPSLYNSESTKVIMAMKVGRYMVRPKVLTLRSTLLTEADEVT